MKNIGPSLSVLAFLTTSVAQSQTFSFTETTIDPNPTLVGGTSYEKTIGYFTSTSYPSYFLGSQAGAYLYDPVKGLKFTIDPGNEYYERAKPFLFPGDTYPGIIASRGGQLVWLQNPANWDGGDAAQPWGSYVINPNSGCHDLVIAVWTVTASRMSHVRARCLTITRRAL